MDVVIPLETWFYSVPPVTRYWMTLSVVASALVHCEVISPFQLFYSYHSAIVKQQYWRFLTSFIYFGPLSLDFVFHIFFMSRYPRMLEESFYLHKTSEFIWLLLYSASSLILLSPFASLPFLGSPLSFSLVYIWARRNPTVNLSFLGLFVFSAPYLPWILFIFAYIISGDLPQGDLLGIAVGHVYFFFEDIFPRLYGFRPLAPPWKWSFFARNQQITDSNNIHHHQL
ncbi:Derlin-2 [Lipomyces oligophaga]|uniref:Derlin-2 n=1 Tax=Lipomyces oligophaga TaxID=45792 RepID=UPI0034CD7B2F